MTLALLLFAFIAGVRWQVGTDHLGYLAWYEQLIRDGVFRASGVEAGFDFITKVFAHFNMHFTFFFGFLAFLQLFFIYRAFKDERYLYPFLGIVIILGPEFLSWMNGMRQMIAATIFVYSIQYIRERKLISYFIIIVLASLIHQSAILLLVFYFIPQKDYFKNRFINLGLLIITLLRGLSPTWMKIGEFARTALSLVGYDRYAIQMDTYFENFEEMRVGPRRIIMLLLNVFTIWYAPKLKEHFKNTNYLIYFNFTFIGVLLHNLLANTHHVFIRPTTYFTLFLAITTAYLLFYLKPQKRNVVTFRFLLIFIVSSSYTFFSVIADYGKGNIDFSNFKFFWDYL